MSVRRGRGGSRERIAAADALLFCTPEYAGTLPGSLKNLLDWTVGGGEIYGKPVGWINVAMGGRGTGAEEHLAMVLRYVGAVAVERACVRVPVPRERPGPTASSRTRNPRRVRGCAGGARGPRSRLGGHPGNPEHLEANVAAGALRLTPEEMAQRNGTEEMTC